jgi:hypothetical protein
MLVVLMSIAASRPLRGDKWAARAVGRNRVVVASCSALTPAQLAGLIGEIQEDDDERAEVFKDCGMAWAIDILPEIAGTPYAPDSSTTWNCISKNCDLICDTVDFVECDNGKAGMCHVLPSDAKEEAKECNEDKSDCKWNLGKICKAARATKGGTKDKVKCVIDQCEAICKAWWQDWCPGLALWHIIIIVIVVVIVVLSVIGAILKFVCKCCKKDDA